MDEPEHGSTSSSSFPFNRDSSGAGTSNSYQVREEEVDVDHHHNHFRHPELEEQPVANSFRGNFFAFDDDASSVVRDDTWSCVVVLLTFWFFVSMTLILGVYGPVNIQLGPNCSFLLQPNSIFVQSIKLQEVNKQDPGLMLYGFYDTPSLDKVTTWSEARNVSIPTDSHKEWIYYLNAGSQINISYSVYSSSSIFLVIADGYDDLAQWLEEPTYPNTTLSWNVVQGSGTISQDITTSSSYYVAVGSLNSEDVEVELNLSIRSFIYNTSGAYYKCNLTQGTCSMKILFPKGNTAVLNSIGPEEGASVHEWYVKLSYGPRWITYILGIGGLTVVMLSFFHVLNKFQCSRDEARSPYEPIRSDREPLLSHKDDDLSSWGSSYDSVSHDEEDLEDFLVIGSLEGKALGDGENSNNTRRLCAICFDAPRDCFFLPCGHCVSCFACGSRIAEADCICPICRRKMKKVRKIFTV
ncbi:hypothetical protein UlMin_000608 [Ulmus minor]